MIPVCSYYDNPHAISNKNIIFENLNGRYIKCTLGDKVWKWDLKLTIEDINACMDPKSWVCSSDRATQWYFIAGLSVKYIHFQRNAHTLNAIAHNKNNHINSSCLIKILAIALKILTLGQYDLYKHLLYDSINKDHWNGHETFFFKILFDRGYGDKIRFTDKVPDDSDIKKRLALAFKMYIEGKIERAPLEHYVTIDSPDFTFDGLYESDANPWHRGQDAPENANIYLGPGDEFLHGYHLDKGYKLNPKAPRGYGQLRPHSLKP